MSIGARVADGAMTEIFEWENTNILKLYLPEAPPDSAAWEINRTRAALDAGLPVPEVVDAVEIDGRQGIIFARVTGPTMREELMNKPHRLIVLARQLAELHAEIHKHTAANLTKLETHIEQRILQTTLLAEAMKSDLLAQLAQLPSGKVICHGDFHPGNIIMTADGPVIIDWVDTTVGNPIADVARTALLIQPLPLSPAVDPTLREFFTNMMSMFRAIYIQRYRELLDFSHDELANWELIVIAARMTEFNMESIEDLADTIRSLRAEETEV